MATTNPLSMSQERTYIAIDLKSFYASVECVERGLNPLTTHLVVADESRTEKTICLAVSPSLKAYGISGRARLFEAVQRVRDINNKRRLESCGHRLTGKSYIDSELKAHPDWEVDFIRATPRMAFYIEYSRRIYAIYLKYISAEDIHVYSIDEVFMDVTGYLKTYKMSAHELAITLIREVLQSTGITATAGIGTNLYLAKVAMDIVAKHIPANQDGVRIASLDEMSYRKQLWDHQPLTDFWRVGRGIANKLAPYGIDTMGKIARMSLQNEEYLYKLFGVNAELLIDHAWGWEPCTIKWIKAYRPSQRSMSKGQVLSVPYTFQRAQTIVWEMADAISLELVEKRLVTTQLALTIHYDHVCLTRPDIATKYHGPIGKDHYGRPTPRHSHGTIRLSHPTSSTQEILKAIIDLYTQITHPDLLIRRINITAEHICLEDDASNKETASAVQLDLFADNHSQSTKPADASRSTKERQLQESMLIIQHRYGKNAILKGRNYDEWATARERNTQIGGHKA